VVVNGCTTVSNGLCSFLLMLKFTNDFGATGTIFATNYSKNRHKIIELKIIYYRSFSLDISNLRWAHSSLEDIYICTIPCPIVDRPLQTHMVSYQRKILIAGYFPLKFEIFTLCIIHRIEYILESID